MDFNFSGNGFSIGPTKSDALFAAGSLQPPSPLHEDFLKRYPICCVPGVLGWAVLVDDTLLRQAMESW